jgi:hypothetical protein
MKIIFQKVIPKNTSLGKTLPGVVMVRPDDSTGMLAE